MNKSPIFIGLNPSRAGFRKNCTMDRLYRWYDTIGIRYAAFGNLTSDPDWNFKYNTLDLNFVKKQIDTHVKVIALGSTVSSYLTRMNIDHFRMEHPSPRNRNLNDPSHEALMVDRCKNYIFS